MTDELNIQEQSIGFSLWQASNTWQRLQREVLSKIGLTHVQFLLLKGIEWLETFDTAVTQIRLASHVQTDPMMTSQVVRTLHTRKLIKRIQMPQDARSFQLMTTQEGRDLLDKASILVEKVDQNFFGKLKEKELSFFFDLQTLLENSK